VSLSTGESLWTYEEADGDRLWELTLGDLLRTAAAEHPGRAALVDAGPDPAQRRSWTYTELLSEAERVARALLARFRPGERVAENRADRPRAAPAPWTSSSGPAGGKC